MMVQHIQSKLHFDEEDINRLYLDEEYIKRFSNLFFSDESRKKRPEIDQLFGLEKFLLQIESDYSSSLVDIIDYDSLKKRNNYLQPIEKDIGMINYNLLKELGIDLQQIDEYKTQNKHFNDLYSNNNEKYFSEKIFSLEDRIKNTNDLPWTDQVRNYQEALEKHGVVDYLTVQDASVPIPDEYVDIAQQLAKHHHGLRYTGLVSLKDKSQHNVDILSFEYEEGSMVHELRIVAKDINPFDARIPEFLRQHGIAANLVYDAQRKIIMQHVGSHDLRTVVRNGSDTDLISSCEKALDAIAKVQIVASQNLHSLESDYGISLPEIHYTDEFKSRFIWPIIGKQSIISPHTHSLMQAYNAFTKTFKAQFFTHGDFHAANCRMSEQSCYIIDWEWAKIGRKFDDIARFVNAVTREREDADVPDFREDMYTTFVRAHNEHSEQYKHPMMLPNHQLRKAYTYSLINDELYKIGEYVLFGNAHPNVKEEKLEKSARCFERTVSLIDEALEEATISSEQKMLTQLRESLIAATATSAIDPLREAALMYTHRTSPSVAKIVPVSQLYVPQHKSYQYAANNGGYI